MGKAEEHKWQTSYTKESKFYMCMCKMYTYIDIDIYHMYRG